VSATACDELLSRLTAADAELAERAVTVDRWDTTVSVCSLEDLRRMKRAAGRTSDLAYLEGLEDPHPGP